jgi:hypothetical protein
LLVFLIVFAAFAFHRTAYRERSENVREALAVIERLRNYLPKGHKSSIRTPVFGSLGFSSEKGNFPSALNDHQQRRHGSGSQGWKEDTDADTEDGERTVVGTGSSKKSTMKGKEKRGSSWMRMASRTNTDGTIRSQNIPSPTAARPLTPSGINPQENSSSHRYPPGAHSGVEGEATIVQAAKVLKTAVLHDARNITKGDDDGLGNIAWNVNSAHEAKVLSPLFCH